MRPLVLAGLLLAGCTTPTAAGPGGEQPLTAGQAQAHSSLPDFELRSIDGETVHLRDLLGKQVVVLSFWATWCEPCKAELPQLQKIYEAHHKEGLEILSVSMDDASSTANVAPYVKRNGIQFPVLLDPDTRAASLYNPHKSAPYTVVIGRDGKIVSEKSGYEPGAEATLEAELVTLLKAPAAP
jgi:peroxiredoxin